MNKFRNFIPLQGFSLRYNHYAYIDTSNNYKGDLVFIENKLKGIKFTGDYKNPNIPYSVIMCKVRKKDDNLFRECMEKLKDKMLILGNIDYQEFCENLINMLEAECEE